MQLYIDNQITRGHAGADPGFVYGGGGAQARFCRHRAAESRRRQKFGPQNGGWGGGADILMT